MPSLISATRFLAIATGLVLTTSAVNAAAPVAVGKRALLTLKIEIDGAGNRVSRSDGVDVKWSTRRVLEAKVELVAGAMKGTSAADIKDQVAAATAGPSARLAALQKEAEKCKQGDTACQMAIAMKMMETDEAKGIQAREEAAQAAPPRFQTWEAPKAGRVEVTAEYQEQWDGVFLTASREVRTCKSAYAGPANVVKDRETLQTGLRAVDVEVDTKTGTSALLMVVGSFVAGDLKCHINDGGRVFDERDNKSLGFAPPFDHDATAGWMAGGLATPSAISRAEVNYATKPEARSITGMMSVTAPLKVKVRWELVPL